MKQYQRPEPQLRLCGHAPPTFEASLFTASYAANDESDSINLRKVLAGNFVSFTNMSMKEIWANSELLCELQRRDNWSLATAAWKVGVLPEAHIVHNTFTGKHFILFKVRPFQFSRHCIRSSSLHSSQSGTEADPTQQERTQDRLGLGFCAKRGSYHCQLSRRGLPTLLRICLMWCFFLFANALSDNVSMHWR
jgi:hypothetical protein